MTWGEGGWGGGKLPRVTTAGNFKGTAKLGCFSGTSPSCIIRAWPRKKQQLQGHKIE